MSNWTPGTSTHTPLEPARRNPHADLRTGILIGIGITTLGWGLFALGVWVAVR